MTSLQLIDTLITLFDNSPFHAESFECKPIKNKCHSTKRIIHAMKYYSSFIDQQHDSNDKCLRFAEIYPSMLDDFIHIIQNHNDNLMLKQYDIKQCDFTNCSALLRHYRNKVEADNDESTFYRTLLDNIHCFVFHSYDVGLRVHQNKIKTLENVDNSQFSNMRNIILNKAHGLTQLNGIGENRFSCSKFNLNVNVERIYQQTNDSRTYMDGLYEYLNDHFITCDQWQRLHQFIVLEEFDSDALCDDIHQKSNIRFCLHRKTCQIQKNTTKIKDCLKCICGDLLLLKKSSMCYAVESSEVAESAVGYNFPVQVGCDLCGVLMTGVTNVYHCKNGRCSAHENGFDCCLSCAENLQTETKVALDEVTTYDFIVQYVQHTKLSEYCFSVGYRFYYWNYYKENTDLSQLQPPNNRYHHSGYEPYELFIEQKYQCIKDELLNNKIKQLSPTEFAMSFTKAQEYINSNEAKKYKAQVAEFLTYERLFYRNTYKTKNVYKIYGIKDGTVLGVCNLLSVIIYCDYSDLSQEFSKTFRKTKAYQTILTIKKNNREYAIWSKTLRETVELYGHNRFNHFFDENGQKVYPATGPFFCGLSYVLAMPEFDIRLCAPTSTSKKIEVATRFGGDTGMILQLNNSECVSNQKLRCFNCSWISNYSAEDERLFFGGAHRIRIENIRKIKHAVNLSAFFKPLFYFNCMVNGTSMSVSPDITKIDKTIIYNLINHKLRINGYQNKYSKYVNDTFAAFVNQPTLIVLNLPQIGRHFKPLKHYIIQKNRLNDVIFRLFKNIKKLIIYSSMRWFEVASDQFEVTSDRFDGVLTKEYPFGILQLLSSIQSTFTNNSLQIVIKANSSKYGNQSWIGEQYESLSVYLKRHSKVEKIKLELKQDNTSNVFHEDTLFITYTS